jgi:hypothetical protein
MNVPLERLPIDLNRLHARLAQKILLPKYVILLFLHCVEYESHLIQCILSVFISVCTLCRLAARIVLLALLAKVRRPTTRRVLNVRVDITTTR